MREFELIDRLTARSLKNLAPGVVGAGDDCAVIPLGAILPGVEGGERNNLLITTDLMVENVHFRSATWDPADIGWKLLAVNLSDIASMGGEPRGAVITLQLPSELSTSFVDALYQGIYECAEVFGVALWGGDTSRGSEISLGITLLGVCDGPPLLRTGAMPGDDLYVSGTLGLAHAGFRASECRETTQILAREPEQLARCNARFFRPVPRIALGAALRSLPVSAALDVSDGVIQDAGHLARRSCCTIEIRADEIVDIMRPPTPEDALTGGEDYELLFCASPKLRESIAELARQLGLPLTTIGTVPSSSSKGGDIRIRTSEDEVVGWERYAEIRGIDAARGYEHF